jgi:WD40 repeat protein
MALIYRDQAGTRLRAVAWSPDGTRIASASSNGVVSNPAGLVQVWEAETGATILSYRGHHYGAMDVAWAPDGQRLASAGGPDGTAQVWEAESGRLLVTYQDREKIATAAAIQQQGTRGALVGVGLPYDAMIPAALAFQWVQSLGWTAHGQRVVSTCSSRAHVWESNTGRHLFTYGSHRSQIVALAVSPDGTRAATLTGWLVQLWETVEKGRGLFIYRGHANDGSRVESLAWSPDGTRLASGNSNGVVQVWDARSGETLLTYRGHNPDEQLITNPANLSSDDPLENIKMLNRYLSQHLGDPRFTSVSPTESHKILQEHIERGMRAANAALRGERPPENAPRRRVNTWNVSALAWSPDSTRLVSGSWDKTVQVWDARTGELLSTYQDHAAAVTAVAWSPDGSRIASADLTGTVHVWPMG